jgi:hypothetical protein
MPFVAFKNSVGRGLILPDGHGGTKLAYLRRKSSDDVFKALNLLDDKPEVVVEHVDVDRVVEAPESGDRRHGEMLLA